MSYRLRKKKKKKRTDNEASMSTQAQTKNGDWIKVLTWIINVKFLGYDYAKIFD